MGSSPRVWGQAGQCRGNEAAAGIIPTRVGTSDEELMNELKKRDHPHACGDKPLYMITTRQIVGSSPRVWGQVKVINMRGSKRRIIPTRVGTRFICCCVFTCISDHPHACGDKVFLVCLYYTTGGSSPRVWGQASLSPALTLSPRIIPTRVGTSVPSPT